MEPIFRAVDPAKGLDIACESLITSALSDQPLGTSANGVDTCHNSMS
jgi:hypothetical protein